MLTGDPASALAGAVADRSLDLVVLGAHSRKEGWREFLGTLSGDAVLKVECDLLLVNGGY